jgi:hypothetical protein
VSGWSGNLRVFKRAHLEGLLPKALWSAEHRSALRSRLGNTPETPLLRRFQAAASLAAFSLTLNHDEKLRPLQE